MFYLLLYIYSILNVYTVKGIKALNTVDHYDAICRQRYGLWSAVV